MGMNGSPWSRGTVQSQEGWRGAQGSQGTLMELGQCGRERERGEMSLFHLCGVTTGLRQLSKPFMPPCPFLLSSWATLGR